MKGDKIKYRKGYKYQLAETYSVQTCICGYDIDTEFIRLAPNGLLTILKGYAWDGASGPTWDSPCSMRPSLIHDAIYQLIRAGLLPADKRDEGDKILKKTCLEDGMWRTRVAYWYWGVCNFAAFAADPATDRKIYIAP